MHNMLPSADDADQSNTDQPRTEAQAIRASYRQLESAHIDPTRLRRLPPRQQETLVCLLQDNTEKEAAARLGISHHTLHDYVKALYKFFNINSRRELIAMFIRDLRP